MKVLIAAKCNDVLLESFTDAGFECILKPNITYDEMSDCIYQYYGVIVSSRNSIDKKIIDKSAKLKFIGRLGSGMEHIDTKYAYSKGVKCYSSPEGNRDAVAEHVIGMLLTLVHKISSAQQELRSGIWNRERNRGDELMGKTVGIIGFGNTGSSIAKKLAGFELNIIAFDKYKSGFGSDTVKEVTMNDVFHQSDILSLHIPLTAETYHLINDEFLGRFSKKIILINTSRGEIVESEALIKALKGERLKGACLDVFEKEPMFQNKEQSSIENEMLKLSNVILTPHSAGLTRESDYKLAKVLADKILTDL